MIYLTAEGEFLLLSSRQKTIILYVLGHPEGVSGKKLSEHFHASEKTIRKDLSMANQWLRSEGFEIRASQRNGYYIAGENRGRINDLLEEQCYFVKGMESQTPLERRLSVMDRALGRPGSSLDVIAEYLHVSENTIYKDISYMEKLFEEEYGLPGMVVQNHQIYMKAGEKEIRKLVFRIIEGCIVTNGQLMDNSLYHLMRGIVNLKEINTFYQYVVEFCKERKIVVSDQVLYMAAWKIFYVNVRREETHFMEDSEWIFRQDQLADFLQYMNQTLFLEMEDCDLEFIYQELERIGFPTGKDETDEKLRELLDGFYHQVNEKYQISFDENAELKADFEKDVACLVKRILSDSQISRIPGTKSVISGSDEENEIPKQAVGILADMLFNEYGKKVNSFETERLLEYIHAVGWKTETELHVLVIYGADKGWYHRVCRWIGEKFRGIVQICGACPLYLLEDECIKVKPDLVITPQTMDVQFQIPQLVFSGVPSETEERRVYTFLEGIMKNKNH